MNQKSSTETRGMIVLQHSSMENPYFGIDSAIVLLGHIESAVSLLCNFASVHCSQIIKMTKGGIPQIESEESRMKWLPHPLSKFLMISCRIYILEEPFLQNALKMP